MVFATHFGPDAFKQHGLTPTRCLFATYDSTSANCVDGLLDGLSKESTRCRWWISTSSTKNATFHPDPTISKHMASPRNKPELPKILVADDDRWLLESMADWLSGIGYQVQTASNIEQAKKACAHGKYDLMLCDVRFEDGDGLTLLKRIRSKHPTLPVPTLLAKQSQPVLLISSPNRSSIKNSKPPSSGRFTSRRSPKRTRGSKHNSTENSGLRISSATISAC